MVGNTEVGIEMKFKAAQYPVVVSPVAVPELNQVSIDKCACGVCAYVCVCMYVCVHASLDAHARACTCPHLHVCHWQFMILRGHMHTMAHTCAYARRRAPRQTDFVAHTCMHSCVARIVAHAYTLVLLQLEVTAKGVEIGASVTLTSMLKYFKHLMATRPAHETSACAAVVNQLRWGGVRSCCTYLNALGCACMCLPV